MAKKHGVQSGILCGGGEYTSSMSHYNTTQFILFPKKILYLKSLKIIKESIITMEVIARAHSLRQAAIRLLLERTVSSKW